MSITLDTETRFSRNSVNTTKLTKSNAENITKKYYQAHRNELLENGKEYYNTFIKKK